MLKTILKYGLAVTAGMAVHAGAKEMESVQKLASADGIKGFAGKAIPYLAGAVGGTAVGVVAHHILRDADKVGVAGV